jgi:mannitol-1-/sugar-/sorbitol-6-/2-deoxyglucose-6-phosphatase
MPLRTVIFDMDGLLVDSEPLWNEAATEVFARHGMKLGPADYALTTGLRTKEFVQWWFARFGVDMHHAPAAETEIVDLVIEKFSQKGKAFPGVGHIFDFFAQRGFACGLATSSGMPLVDAVVDSLGIRQQLHAIVSAAALPYGKPHPQVYLDCAAALGSHPTECICFEDSFNGMIAAKAARMKCVVVPAYQHAHFEHWKAADLKIASLQNFNQLLLEKLDH